MDERVLAGRYVLGSLLGQGGMADVYLATDQVLGRQVAVKVLGSHFARDASFVTRFRREAQAAAALNHPNVVGVFDTGSDDGTHFIVMEHVQGKTLAEIIREDAPLLPERAVEIAGTVATALAFAHHEGIVHRDVKPANIMIGPTGDVKVMDFGIARAATSESITQTATVLGTATYFSPEQAQGQPVDARSDIYSVGVVLYEMLTATPPFSGESVIAIAFKHVNEDAPHPSSLNPDVPPALDAIVMKCLAKNPANRYASAEELAEDLGRFGGGEPVMATPLLPPEPTQVVARQARPTTVLPPPTLAPDRRRRRWVAAIMLGLLAVALVAGLIALAGSLLSNNENLVTVPCRVGSTRAAAFDALNKAGFQPHQRRVGSAQPADTVVSCDPLGDQPKGSAITVLLSDGSGAVRSTTIPDLTCVPEDQARQILTARHLQVQVATQDSTACPPGDVIRTEPPKGSKVDEGSAVTIFVATQPSPSPTTPSPSPTTPSPSPTPTPTTPSPPPTTPSPTPSATTPSP